MRQVVVFQQGLIIDPRLSLSFSSGQANVLQLDRLRAEMAAATVRSHDTVSRSARHSRAPARLRVWRPSKPGLADTDAVHAVRSNDCTVDGGVVAIVDGRWYQRLKPRVGM